MIISKFHIKYFFFFIFLLIHSLAFSNKLQFDGLSKLTIDDIQSLTSVDILDDNINEIYLDSIIRDLYSSDLIYDVDYKYKNNLIIFNITENKLIEQVYMNGNIRMKDADLLSVIETKINFYLNKDTLKKDITSIRDFYNSMGYIDNSIQVKKEKYSDNRINLIFEINEGPRYRITNVKFIGNSSFSDKYLYSKINTKTLSSYNIFKSGSNFVEELFDYDLAALENFYQQKGYFDVNVEYKLKKNRAADFQLIYYVDEGERYLIDEIIYEYPSFLKSKDNILNIIDKFEKNIENNDNYFDYFLVKDHVKKVNKKLKSQGLYEIEATHTYDQVDNRNILRFFEIQLEKKYINKINIFGNAITKDKTLRSKIEVEPGDLYSEFRVKNDSEALKNLKYINKVEADIVKTKDLVDLTYEIDENKKTGEFMIGGSYSADVGVGLAVNLKDSNYRGTGDEIELKFSGNTEKLLYSLFYNTYDRLNSYQTNSYSISNEETDLSGSFGYKTKSQALGYARHLRIDENLSTSIGVALKMIEGYDPVLDVDFINDNIDTYNQTNFNFNIKFDNTDDIFFPTNGIKSGIGLTHSPESLSKDSFTIADIHYDHYKKLKDSDRYIFTANDIGFADGHNSNLKTINSFSLGGSNFKGFDYRGIGPKRNGAYLGGNNFFTSTVGYGGSFLFDEKDNLNIRLFHTIGSIWGSDYSADNKFKLRSSVGASLDFLSQIGPISLSYAIPIEKETNDISREFNFILGASF